VPDPTPILPYLGLFTIEILKPEYLNHCCIPTLHLPTLSILENNRFIIAPDGTSPADENVARIFDAAAITDKSQKSAGWIPLSPEDPEFDQQYYWRLTVDVEVVLAALFAQTATFTPFGRSNKVHTAQAIFCMLGLQGLGRT
jgi:hypothetical protein